MEFEEMQIIWNEQNNEKMFAINEAALHKYIKAKSQSVNHLMQFAEWVMIIANLLVVVVLTWDAANDNGPIYQYVISGLYLVYGVVALIRRFRRQKAETFFKPTMLGEVDKAIWQVNYLIEQSRSIVYWYILPLAFVVSASFIFAGKFVWAIFVLLILIPAGILGPRWEINKAYMPKKRALENLRQTLLAPEPEISD